MTRYVLAVIVALLVVGGLGSLVLGSDTPRVLLFFYLPGVLLATGPPVLAVYLMQRNFALTSTSRLVASLAFSLIWIGALVLAAYYAGVVGEGATPVGVIVGTVFIGALTGGIAYLATRPRREAGGNAGGHSR